MKLYLLVCVLVLGGCVGLAATDGVPVSVFDCKRWEAGRAVPSDVAAVCERAWRRRLGDV